MLPRIQDIHPEKHRKSRTVVQALDCKALGGIIHNDRQVNGAFQCCAVCRPCWEGSSPLLYLWQNQSKCLPRGSPPLAPRKSPPLAQWVSSQGKVQLSSSSVLGPRPCICNTQHLGIWGKQVPDYDFRVYQDSPLVQRPIQIPCQAFKTLQDLSLQAHFP